MKALLLSLLFVFSVGAQAENYQLVDGIMTVQNMVMADVQALGLNFKVGDTNNYNLNMGFISGTMVMKVREQVAEGFWIQQDMNLGFMGQQKIEVLIDPNTGKTLKLIVNGQEQTPPSADDVEVIDMKEDHITVPAGSFDAIHITAKNKKDNTQINQWVNPKLIPISGMLKSIAPSQLGEVKIELTSFKKN